MEELVLNVSGMTCDGCEQRIRSALGRLDGVRVSAADHRSGEVRVLLDPQRASTVEVQAAIADAGYEAVT